ncbi:hypothetical protein HAX54_038517 [Datura stramonium]|uniref:Uncharacterized protein n=1 Tax=Datura stramonium TaxID=4076 RepID=A0ABS8VJX6_DATST|nr:hypothetical protein [Datura stramonium]
MERGTTGSDWWWPSVIWPEVGGAGERKFGGFGVWEFAGEDGGEGNIGRSGGCLVSFGFWCFVGVEEERKKRERVWLLGELKRKRGEGRGSGDRREGEGGKGSDG